MRGFSSEKNQLYTLSTSDLLRPHTIYYGQVSWVHAMNFMGFVAEIIPRSHPEFYHRSSSTKVIRILDWQRFSPKVRISLPMSPMMKGLLGQNRNQYISVTQWNQISKSFRHFLQKNTLDQE